MKVYGNARRILTLSWGEDRRWRSRGSACSDFKYLYLKTISKFLDFPKILLALLVENIFNIFVAIYYIPKSIWKLYFVIKEFINNIMHDIFSIYRPYMATPIIKEELKIK